MASIRTALLTTHCQQIGFSLDRHNASAMWSQLDCLRVEGIVEVINLYIQYIVYTRVYAEDINWYGGYYIK